MHSIEKQKLECALYVVATPIGNLRDITLRALDVLASADVIAAEDTRNTLQLLKCHGIAPDRLISLHRHNELAGAEKIQHLLAEGKSVALVSDAGTPGISDPGTLLVRATAQAGHRVIPIPGANAAAAALSASGLGEGMFTFCGFLPSKPTARRKTLESLKHHAEPLVFYEAPHRLLECTQDLLDILGGAREIVFARELTKLFEDIHRCPLSEAITWITASPNNQRGEFVLVVAGAGEIQRSYSDSERLLPTLLKELPLKQAVSLAAEISGESRKKLYQTALQLKADE